MKTGKRMQTINNEFFVKYKKNNNREAYKYFKLLFEERTKYRQGSKIDIKQSPYSKFKVTNILYGTK